MVEGEGRIRVGIGNKEFVTIEVKGKRLDADVINLAAGRGLILRVLSAISSVKLSDVSNEIRLLSMIGGLLERKGYVVNVKIGGETVARLGVAAKHSFLGPLEILNVRTLLKNIITSFFKPR